MQTNLLFICSLYGKDKKNPCLLQASPPTEGYPVTFTISFDLQLKAECQVWHHYFKCYAAVVSPHYTMLVKAVSVPRYTICWYKCLPASFTGCTEMEFSKLLGLAKTLPEVQLLLKVNISCKLLSKMQRNMRWTQIPGSNSAWKVKQWLDPEQGGTSSFYLLSKLLCCAVRVICTERPASFVMASNSLRLLFAKFSSISLVQQV